MEIHGKAVNGVKKEIVEGFELNFNVLEEGHLIEIELKNLLNVPNFLGEIKIGELDGADKLFVNNFQSWGPCTFVNPHQIFEALRHSDLQVGFGVSPIPWEFKDGIISDYFVANDHEFAGFLSSKISHPYFKWHDDKIDVKIYLGKTLMPHERIKIEKLWVSEFNDLENVLERYASKVSEENLVRSSKPLLGWESWYSYYLEISEELFTKELENTRLKYEVFQIDDGYEKDIGDWLDTNDKFPNGLELMARKIKEKGMKAGIWTAPFSVSETSSIFKDHKDFLVKDDNGVPIVAYENWNKKIYALDTSNPDALDWLEKIFSTLKSYGYEFFKIDFLFSGMIPGKRFLNVTPVEAYRMGMKKIADIIGSTYVLGCGAPLLPSIGYVDSMRIGTDTSPTWNGLDIGTPSAKYSIRNALTRNFMSAWWVNDPDCVMARTQKTQLSKNEKMVNIYIPALLNGQFLESDFLTELTDEDLHLLTNAMNFRNGRSRVKFEDEERYIILTKNSKNGDIISFVNLSDSRWNDNLSKYRNLLEKKEDEFFVSYPSMKIVMDDLSVDPRSILIILHRGKRHLRRDDEKEDDGRDIHYYWGDDYDGTKI